MKGHQDQAALTLLKKDQWNLVIEQVAKDQYPHLQIHPNSDVIHFETLGRALWLWLHNMKKAPI